MNTNEKELLGYKVWLDIEEGKWHFDKIASVVGEHCDECFWSAFPADAEETCIKLNRQLVETPDLIVKNGDHCILTCKDCGEKYVLWGGEYFWFTSREMKIPKRCDKCRKKRKELKVQSA